MFNIPVSELFKKIDVGMRKSDYFKILLRHLRVLNLKGMTSLTAQGNRVNKIKGKGLVIVSTFVITLIGNR